MRIVTIIYTLVIICVLFSCKQDDTNESVQKQAWYKDADADTFGTKDETLQAITKPEGYVTNNEDCNDYDATINPNAQEKPDGIDNNCDGEISKCTSDSDCDGDCTLGFCTKKSLKEKFSKKYFPHNYTGKKVPYYYYTPKNEENKKLPLVVSLHGAENFASNETRFLNFSYAAYMALAWLEDANQAKYPCYVLAPHVYNGLWNDEGYNRWDSESGTDLVDKLLQKFIADNPNVDTSKIYLTGHSMGGAGTWYIGAELNTTFAAIVPLSNAMGQDDVNELTIKVNKGSFDKLPTWNFIHRRDAVKASRGVFNSFKDRGYQIVNTHTFGEEDYNLTKEQIHQEIDNGKKYFHTEYNYSNCYLRDCHYSMHYALRDPLLFEWLFKQQKK